MNLIPVFVAIMEERSLSKAAARLDISQPAVSKALKRLRDIYQDPLVHRTTTGVTPTSFAQDIYPPLASALEQFDSTLKTARDFDPARSERVFSIACQTSASYTLINRLVAKVAQEAPNLVLEVHPVYTEDLESDLRLKRYDLAIDLYPKGRTFLQSQLLLEEPLLVVAANRHPRLLGDKITEPQYLKEKHVVVTKWQSRTELLSDQQFPLLQQRDVICRAPGVMESLAIISASHHIGIAPRSLVRQFRQVYGLRDWPLPFECPLVKLYALWHPNRGSDAGHRWLREQMRIVAEEYNAEN